MNIKFDHIIHYIKGIEDFYFPGNKLNINPGGKHLSLGTLNSLSRIDLSYIEFIDVFDKSLIEKAMESEKERLSFASSIGRTHYEEGFKRLCFRTDDIDALHHHYESMGLNTIGPLKMERVTPTGELIQWQLLYIDDERDFELPFFIQWGDTDDVRYEQLKVDMQPQLEIDTIFIEAYDFDAIAEVFIDWLGYEVMGGVINTYFLLKREGFPHIKIIPGNMNAIKRIEIKTQDASIIGEHLVHGAVYAFI
ncbi:VOC family protein [Macrococcus animalis]|uniref:VOC family protein n=1 Tax=Macrococcus animalis TaxID=3395467 RepID=UPI0039BEA144